MDEKKIEIAIPSLLPDVMDEQDGCLDRLASILQDRNGIHRAHLERDKSPVSLCLHFDPEIVSANEVGKVAKRAGNKILNRYRHKSLRLDGLDCSDCAQVIQHSLGRLEGVLGADVDYAGQILRVEYDAQHISQRAIERRVRQLGYELVPSKWRGLYQANRELLYSLLGGLALLVGWFGLTFLRFPLPIAIALYLAAYAFAGFDITRHALHHLRNKILDTHLLMVLAALGAAALGQFSEGALLLFLFSLGHALEERALDRARAAVRALAGLSPKTALVRRQGVDMLVPVDRIAIGETVVIAPGVRVPVDGEVVSGRSSVNQSPVTGESLPVDKASGDQVFAGSVNGEGVLDVRATRLAKDSTLSRVMAMVEQAQAQKSPTQQRMEKFMRIFVPSVLVVDILLIVIPPLFGVPFAESFLRAMTLLVAASPCALALAAPSAILSGVAQAARNGVLVKGGVHLENLGRIQAIAFDKTGTLTTGQPQVTDILAREPRSEAEVLALAAAIEARSAHPLAQAIVQAAVARRLDIPEASQVEALTGRGIRAQVAGRNIIVGRPEVFGENASDNPGEFGRQVANLQEQGKSVMLVGLDEQVIGAIAVADRVRPNAREALEALKQVGIDRTIMLTGDNPQVAAQVAARLGVNEVRAGLLPEDKLVAVRELLQEGRIVGMVGDGINDAPALANATVGIAMGSARTEVALETADVALMASDLEKLPFAVGLGRATWRVIQQNLFISLAVIFVLSGLALTGLAGIGVAIVFHEGSTLLVALNSLRLLGYKQHNRKV